jgi:type IV secretory pathway protease TraF
MTVLFSSTQAYSNLVKHEYMPEKGYCKKMVTLNQAAATLQIGAVLGAFIASPVATAGAIVGTGNGAIGTVTATASPALQLGTYTLRIVKASAAAGDFVVVDPQGEVVGAGTVAVAYSQGGLAFTLADGSNDFVVGDTIPIVVTGTEKFKLVEATAVDGTAIAKVVIVGDAQGRALPTTALLDTDVQALVIYRGPCAVADDALSYGTSVNTDAEIAALKAQLDAVGIDVLNQL